MMTEDDILHQCGDYWVSLNVRKNGYKEYIVWKCGVTHSVACGWVGGGIMNALERAKNECDRRAAVDAFATMKPIVIG